MKKSKFKPVLKLIIALLIILLAMCFIVGYIWKVSKTADYFKVREVICRDSEAADLSYLKGRNIFSLDLKKEAGYILESYPDYSKINIVRVLPGRLFVDFIRRNPVALVKLYKYFALDGDGVLFHASAEPQESGLPVILGLETKIFGPKQGKKYDIKETALALGIIKGVKRNRVLKNYKINKIDVANRLNTSVFITLAQPPLTYLKGQPVITPESLLEIRLGADDIEEKIVILGGIFSQGKFDLNNVKYIDLRFREPVIKFKDAK